MERDLDLIRQILLEIEQRPYTGVPFEIEIEEYSEEEISYHLLLLDQAGFIEAQGLSQMGGGPPIWRPVSLTWDGHEFLAASRNDTIWNQAKAMMAEKGLGLAIEIVKALLIELAKGQVLS